MTEWIHGRREGVLEWREALRCGMNDEVEGE